MPYFISYINTDTTRDVIGHLSSNHQVANTDKRKTTLLTLCPAYKWRGGHETKPPPYQPSRQVLNPQSVSLSLFTVDASVSQLVTRHAVTT